MVDRCMRTDSSHCDRLLSLSQLKESFLTHLSTIRFSLIVFKRPDTVRSTITQNIVKTGPMCFRNPDNHTSLV